LTDALADCCIDRCSVVLCEDDEDDEEIEQWIRTGRNGSRYSQKTNAAVDGKRFVGNLLLNFEDEIEVVEGMDGKIGGRRESYI
jgi:hypothetical protein